MRTKRPKRITGRQLKAGERSLRYLRKHGWTAEVVEKFVTVGGTKAMDNYIAVLKEQRDRLIRFVCERENPRARAVMPSVEDFLINIPEPTAPSSVGGFRKDPFGFIDILAFRGDEMLAVQTTSRQQTAAHLRKFRSDDVVAEKIRKWLAGGWSFVLHGWECVEVEAKKGGVKAEWQVTERPVEVADGEIRFQPKEN